MPIALVTGKNYRKVFKEEREQSFVEQDFQWVVCFRSSEDNLEVLSVTSWCRAYQHHIKTGRKVYRLGENAYVCENHYKNLPTFDDVNRGNLHSWGAPKNISSIESVEILEGIPGKK